MRKKKLKQMALGTAVGLSIAGLSVGSSAYVTFADDNTNTDAMRRGYYDDYDYNKYLSQLSDYLYELIFGRPRHRPGGNSQDDTGSQGDTSGQDDAPEYSDFKISNIVFTPDEASPGDKVSVRALASESTANVFSFVLEIPVNDQKTEQIHLIPGNNDVLEGYFTVGDNWSNGVHMPARAKIIDSSQKESDVDLSSIEVGAFAVSGSNEDFDTPVLNSVTVDKTEVRADETVTISVDATHSSEIEEIIVTFADEGNRTQSVSFENGSFTQTKNLSGWSEGTYRVTSVFIRDKAGNREYYEENDNLDEVETSVFTISNNYADTQGPFVSGVFFDRDTVSPGETLTVFAEAHDSTGVSYISLDIADPEGKTYNYVLFDDGTGSFSAAITPDNKFLNGEYTVTRISAMDSLGNESGFVPGDDTPELTAGSFTLTGSAHDHEAPHIKSIELLKGNRFHPGQNGAVRVVLADASDIWKAELWLYEENSNEAFDSFYGILQDDGSYLFEFSVDNQWFNDNYDIRINTSDSLSNSASHNTGLQITVYDSPEDYDAPVIKSITADKTDVVPDDVVTLTAEVADDSEIDYVFAGLFLDGQTMVDDEGQEILFRFARGEDGLFRTHIEITHRFLNGDHEVKLSTCDEWSNFVDDMDTDVVLSVSGSQEHTEPPVVTSIMFDKTECVPGDTFTLTATADDEVDVKYVKVYLAASDGTYDEKYNPHMYMTLYPDENGNLSAEGLVDNTWMNKTYEVVYVIAEDVLGNIIHYDDDLLTDLYIAKDLALNFLTVEGSIEDISELHVSEIKFDKEKVNIGDTINIDVKTTGNGKAKEVVLELADTSFERIVWSEKVKIQSDESGNLSASLRIDPSEPFWRKNLNYCVVSVFLLDDKNSSRFYADGIDAEVLDDMRYIERNTFTVDTYAPPVINPADYSAVDAAIAEIPEDLSPYLSEGINRLNEAKEAVIREHTELEQTLVNGYATAIRNAIASLELRPADYTETDKAIADVPEDLSIYTDDSVETLNKALKAVNRDLKIDRQANVDKYTQNIKRAIKDLKLKTADYSGVDEAAATVPADLSMYTEDSVNVLQNALKSIVRDLGIEKQADVDAFAEALNNAVKTLKLRPADYSVVDDVLKTVPEDLSTYTDDSVNLLEEALDKVVRDLTIDKQDQVDTFAKDIEAAISGLKEKEEPEPEKVEPTEPGNKDPEKKEQPAKKDDPVKNNETAKKDITTHVSTPAVKSGVVTVTGKAAPVTGDSKGLPLWGTLSISSAAGIGAIAAFLFRRKRKQ